MKSSLKRRAKPASLKTFTVIVPEVHYTYYTVEATDAEAAKQLVLKGNQSTDLTELSHAKTDTAKWDVEET